MELFWEGHDPGSQSWSRQYRNIIFYHSAEQKKIAEDSRDRLASVTKGKIVTDLLPFSKFYLAEDYHQKYMLRSNPALMEEFKARYPVVEALISSTAAARVNGYLGSNGTCDQLKSEIDIFGLSEPGSKTLLKNVCGGNIEIYCPTKKCS